MRLPLSLAFNMTIALVFGQEFAKRFALCYQTEVVCLSCPVCNVGVLWPNGWMDQDGTWHPVRPPPWPHCGRWGPSSPSQRGTAPNFRPYLLWLDRLRCHLVWRQASAQTILCKTGTQLPSPKWGWSPLHNFRPMSIVAKRLDGSRWHLLRR